MSIIVCDITLYNITLYYITLCYYYYHHYMHMCVCIYIYIYIYMYTHYAILCIQFDPRSEALKAGRRPGDPRRAAAAGARARPIRPAGGVESLPAPTTFTDRTFKESDLSLIITRIRTHSLRCRTRVCPRNAASLDMQDWLPSLGSPVPISPPSPTSTLFAKIFRQRWYHEQARGPRF